ncbi:MAG: MurR/RpiR family transcriptional regulator [Paracoccaceae bacterium]
MALTIAERLAGAAERLTPAEIRLSAALRANYPFNGLGSVTRLAKTAGVSAPTVSRLARKLGFGGFPELQIALRAELEAQAKGPIAKRELWVDEAPTGHALNRFTEAVIGGIRQTLDQIDLKSFDQTAKLLAEQRRAVFVTGGRITRTMAEYFHLHFEVLRPGVTHIRSNSNAWPHQALDIARGDVLVAFDVRRYETSTLKLAEIAKARGAVIVLFTDQWRSPAASLADHVFACRIEAPSAWDSAVPVLLLVETLIAAVQERTWKRTRVRMEALERMFDETGLFQKFT